MRVVACFQMNIHSLVKQAFTHIHTNSLCFVCLQFLLFTCKYEIKQNAQMQNNYLYLSWKSTIDSTLILSY